MTLSEIGSVVAILVAVAGVWIGWRKIKPEVKNMDSNTEKTNTEAVEVYEGIVKRNAQVLAEYQAQIEGERAQHKREMSEVKTLVSEQGIRITQFEAELKTANDRATKFEGWAKRLVHQVQSLGGIPVLLDPLDIGK